MDHGQLMDRIYRYQRHFYDLTRRFFLAGRDELLGRLELRDGQTVLEVGCGTARNLLLLAKKYPGVHLYGLDISDEMLRTARRKTARFPIRLIQGSAEDFHYQRTFGLDRPFDAIFFSYSLSMIPDWQKAVKMAFDNLGPEGSIYIVDFWDLKDWPGWVRGLLVRWLGLFHVRHEPKLIEYLQSLAAGGQREFHLQSILGRYAFLGRLSRPRNFGAK
jgi:S-adenosylmethionine-diacylgycerolhomoserine-N-methlytransferase